MIGGTAGETIEGTTGGTMGGTVRGTIGGTTEGTIEEEVNTILALAGRQSVFTEQPAQLKLIKLLSFEITAVPEKFPEELILTLAKFIQPKFSPQALPDKSPFPSFKTPPFAGLKFIHP